jgi:3-oxoacyl-[acyl-carrier protein] reductase
MGKLAGKVALVTGSGRGIGRSTALKLASEGAAIVVNDMDEGPAAAVIDEIKSGGGKAVACVGNVAAADFGDRMVKTALETFKGVDVIVCNAGYTLDTVVQKMSDADFQTMLDVHVVAPFRLLRAASEPIRLLAKKEAAEGREIFRKVVLISSVSGTRGNPGQINYSSAKAAVTGMTRTMAKEWGRYKVNVNCVAFGYINTRLSQAFDAGDDVSIAVEGRKVAAGIPKAIADAAKSMIPVGRAGTPDEAADSIYLFCCPESNYVSGQVLEVTGGS